jgi:hypothetical protein
MDLAHARVTLSNPRLPQLAAVEVDAPADTGAVHLWIPEHIALQLQLEVVPNPENPNIAGSIAMGVRTQVQSMNLDSFFRVAAARLKHK